MAKKNKILTNLPDKSWCKEEVEQYQKEGVLGVEMEASALYALGTYRNIDVVSLLTPTDSYANLKWEKAIGYTEKKMKALDTLFDVALKVATESEKQKE